MSEPIMIGVDHGYAAMKTTHCTFPTGLVEYEHEPYPDARAIDPDDLPQFDLLCGGFPCQAFSNAGRRKGFADARGTLFFEIARLAEAKRPRYLLLENVP